MGEYCRKCGAARSCNSEDKDISPVKIITKKIVNVPDEIRGELPRHAQQIYIETFNYTYEENKQRDGLTDEDLDKMSHTAAWLEVNKRFEKGTNGKWRPKKD